MSDPTKPNETKRLESLWSGDFGDAYVDRNREAPQHRGPFWTQILSEFPSARVLECGCNLGANLEHIAKVVEPANVYGVDINKKALETLRGRVPGINTVWSPIRELPFRDGWFDMVFTMGVLIHQTPAQLPLVMAEIMRTSRRYVVCGEYFSDEPTEVAYRGETGALFKRDFGGYYQELFPELTLRKQGFLSKAEGWDDVTYWVLEKSR